MILILAAAFLLRLIFVGFGTLNLDLNTFIAWSGDLAGNGFRNFYSGWSDYLPGYLYLLWFLGKVRGVLPDVLLYKLPAILADLATGYLIYKIVDGIKSRKLAYLAAAAYLFNPAVWANSTLWGQVDSLTAFFALLSVFLFDSHFYLSAISLALGTAIKPQAAFVSAVIFFLMVRKKLKFRKMLGYGALSLMVFLITFLPFWNGNNFFQFVFERLSTSFSQYPYTSVNAFNFWGIFGFWKGDHWVTQLTGLLVAFIIILGTGIKLSKKPKSRYLFLSIVFAATFLFLTRIHERHLLPLFAPLTIAAALEPVFLIPLFVFSATYLLNLYYSFNWVTYDFKTVFSSALTSGLSILNLGALAFLVVSVLKTKSIESIFGKITKYLTQTQHKKATLPKIKLGPKTAKILLAIILLFSFVTRVAKLGSPGEMYFDEVYHAFTAKLVLHADPKAWEWWNAHPEGFAYEWTHPPLAKLAMAAGMKIFGENSFGWRIPGALFGVGSVYMVYLLAIEIFSAKGGSALGRRDELVGLLSAAVFSLDGLALSMSRIGMNDTYLVFFVLLSIYFFLKGKDFWSAISFGLALSSKWSAIWAIPIFFIVWLHRKKKFSLSLLWFLLLPFAVYLLTYFQLFQTGHNLGTFWGMQKQMWWYHTGLTATHAYGSSWVSWPFMARPVYLFTSDEIGGWVSRIYTTGNPAVFWFGLVSIAASAVFAFVERNKKLGLTVFCYLIFFVPWAASPRVMFLYHYLPSLAFLSIASGYVLRRFPKTIAYFLVPSALLFIYFYPHWAGLKIPLWLDASYYWLPSWR